MVQGHYLAEGMAAGHVCLKTELFDEGEMGEGDGGNGGLGVLHGREALGLVAELDLIEGGGREGKAV
jgi:hypothetical protein